MMRLYSSSLHFMQECKCFAISCDATSCKQNRQWEGWSRVGSEEYCGRGAKREEGRDPSSVRKLCSAHKGLGILLVEFSLTTTFPRQSESYSIDLLVANTELSFLDEHESLLYNGKTNSCRDGSLPFHICCFDVLVKYRALSTLIKRSTSRG